MNALRFGSAPLRAVGMVAVAACLSLGCEGATVVEVAQVSTLQVTPASARLEEGSSQRLSVAVLDASRNALSGRRLVWSATPAGVVSITSDGVVTAQSAGQATIRVSTEGVEGQAVVEVYRRPVARVEITAERDSLVVGELLQVSAIPRDSAGRALEDRSVTWSSSSPGVASVTGTGLVTAVSPGTTTISATVEGRSASFQLAVAPRFYLAPNGVTVMCPRAEIGDTGRVGGVTYTKRSEQQIRDLVAAQNYALLRTTCTSGITYMSALFLNASAFNEPIKSWDVSAVTYMSRMFEGAAAFNQDLSAWDVSNVTNMSQMFQSADAFNQAIGTWNVRNVENMWGMFQLAVSFDQDLSNWDVGNVRDMGLMFRGAVRFNQPLARWDVSSVESMWAMFAYAYLFNQPIQAWDVARVQDMREMFREAIEFNQDIARWDTGSVQAMGQMFSGARKFNQDLSSWCVGNIASKPFDFDAAATAWVQPRPYWGTCTTVEELQSGGNYSCVMQVDRRIACWGASWLRQIGASGNTPRSLFPGGPVSGEQWQSISATYEHACGLSQTGHAYCWGSNQFGQLGVGSLSEEFIAEPRMVAGGIRWAQVVADQDQTCGVAVSGALYCWGAVGDGRAGAPVGSGSGSLVPVLIDHSIDWADVTMSLGGLCGRNRGGTGGWYCLGNFGQDILASPRRWLIGGRDVAHAAVVGRRSACAVAADDRGGYCFGEQFGGSMVLPFGPVGNGIAWARFESGLTLHYCGIDEGGTGYCWGKNTNGQLGDGTTVDRMEPIQLPGRWRALRPGLGVWGWGNRDHTCGLDYQGTVQCWGSNSDGQLGDAGANEDRSLVPVRVRGLPIK